ncbi:uncharacterized protein LOC109789480 [Cajanus cajan]|uniref:uncharacterized protein LOC109789480 n=1 Tax=Cajanus cajan TaxID=3821 RepID=UPI00098DD16E|nr:uncharacterized protein LOC109789480 [Cajanus cajan]
MNVLVPQQHHHNLSFSQCSFLFNPMKTLHFVQPPARASSVIRMGGGPRTYPGGVSKWQWKRMQERKAKQLLKARLGRERQIYEMRKRAELKAAVSELERPWEAVKREEAPNLFSVGADEQVKVLADRFQRPGGFDMWSERDGPMLFESPDELPSARFFPKGVVHSVKPYRRVDGYGLVKGGLLEGNDCGGGLSEEGIELEDVDGSQLEGDGGEYLSSDVSYGVEGDGGLREKWDGRGVLLEDFGGSELEGDDGECSSSDVSYGRNGVDGHGGLGRNVNGNGMRFLSDDFGKSSDGGRSSRLNYGGKGVDGDGRLRRNGNANGRRLSSSRDGERSSLSNYGRNGMGGDGGLRRNGNGRRVLSDNVDRSKDVEQSSRSNYGRNGVDGDGGLRRNKNGRRVLFDNVGRSSDGGRSSRLNYQRNGLNVDSRMRRDGNGSKYASRGVDDGEHSPRSSSSRAYASSFDGRLRNKGGGRKVLSKDVYGSNDDGLRSKKNGRRFMSKDVDGSSGFYSEGVGSVRKQRGANSIGGRSRGKYTNRNSNYASPRGRGAKSEVYDMGLQQDGSYGFQQKHEQPDSANW